MRPDLKESFGLLVAALGGCGCNEEAKTIKTAGETEPESLYMVLSHVEQRPGLDAEAFGLIAMFKGVVNNKVAKEDFRERCYKDLGVR